MRSAVLVEALQRHGDHPVMALRLGEGGLPNWSWPQAERIELHDEGDVVELAKTRRPDWVAIDGYGLMRGEVVNRLKQIGCRVLAFDDLGTDGAGADLVVNSNRRPEAIAGKLIGPGYALIDASYRSPQRATETGKIDRVLVTFGGSDLHGITSHVVAALKDVPGSLAIDVVIGPYHAVRSFAAPAGHKIALHQQPQGLASLMASADLMISAAGSTCWQACCVGVPLVAVQTADNQREVVNELAARGCAVTFERGEFVRMLGNGGLPELIARFDDPQRREAVRDAQRATVDGQGAARIIAAMKA
jgi:spore coat polysaccharide biosynthesis predicted glycosyltransferase SpsG